MSKIRKTKVTRAAVLVGAAVLCALGFARYGSAGHAHDGPPQNDMAIDKTARDQVVESVIANLNSYYVYPDKAAAIGQQLRAQMQHGDYDNITSAETLADTLTDALRHASQDKHLEVRYFEAAIPVPSADGDGSPDDKVAELLEQQRFNYGFENVDRLHGDIGYIDLHGFARPALAAPRIAAAMSLLSDTKAMIVDLRQCGGGDPETVMLLASYLFDKPTHLNDIYWREGNSTQERWTTASVPGQKYGQSRKLYVLTSEDTFSACEDFAYALKYSGRATVIGETTGGGAHPGSRRRLTAHFMMNVPSGRAINPVTHTDWEVTGVQPDVKTTAKNALDAAQVAGLQSLVSSETDAVWKQKLQHRLDELK